VERLSNVRSVLDTIQRYNLLSDLEHTAVLNTRLDCPLQGFGPISLKLATLNELVDENWLGENIIDARIALYSEELNRREPDLIRIFDCDFHIQLSNAFHARRACSMLNRVREDLLIRPPFLVAFIVNKNGNHWAPSLTALHLRTVFQGDSYGYADEPDLLAMVRWWLRDVVFQDGEWNDRDLAVPQQDCDSGSCGLAAVSAIAKYAKDQDEVLHGPDPKPTTKLWTNATSCEVRCDWIQLMIRRHLLHVELHPVSTPSSSSRHT
jgi:hypothetical protein